VKILIVDDRADERYLLETLLKGTGYEVRSAKNGVEAIVRLHDETFNLIISDILMPEMDGFMLCQQIKGDDSLSRIPFVFYTASYLEPEHEKLAMALGASAFIIKPAEPAELLKKVEEVLTKHREDKLSIPAVAKVEKTELVYMYGEVVSKKLGEKMQELEAEREALRESEKRFRSIFESIQDIYYRTDIHGKIINVSPSCFAVIGYKPEEIIGQATTAFYADPSKHEELMQLLRQKGVVNDYEALLIKKNGSQGTASISTHLVFDDEHRLIGVEGTLRDITERKRAEAKMEHLALYDTLTDLPNRTSLHERLQQTIDSVGPKGSFALFFIGLDRFKMVNETLGHPAGDRALQKVAKRLQQFAHGVSPVARPGGDVFALLLSPLADSQQPSRTAHEILEVFATPLKLEGYAVDVALSIGIALYPHHGEYADTLMARAEVAMGAAKSAHSRIAAYDAGMEQYTLEHLQLAGELRHAIEQNELVLHYQPKINMKEKHIIGVEALVRWQHPEKGFMAPGLFIPMAEQTGLIHPLTYWVLNEALAQISRWHQQGLELVIAVNLAVQNLLDAQLVDVIAKRLHDCEVEPSWLMLEITESSLMAEPVRAQKTLQQLHAMGIRLSIDDFGTGHSSLAYLKDLPVDELKIDQSFILNMSSDETQAMIVRSTIGLAHNLNLKTTAEGIETQEVWDQLQALGCDVAQGYFMGKPLAAADFMCWLQETTWKVRCQK
jgi:diguanylate cyclase (GGDEF)-like protein/PAS domain S-box-containing protein